jgi:nitroreductase
MPTATLTAPAARKADHVIHPLFIERWSPRAYTGEAIPDTVLYAAFEAARWAPSSSNAQPWRFLYSRRGSATWTQFFDFLAEGNRKWAVNASALIVVVSQRTKLDRNGVAQPNKTHSFDAGAAWQNFALQTHLLGWGTRAIGGFDREKARAALKVPEDFAIEAMIAIGKPADKSVLPAEFHEREVPNSRQPIRELVSEGAFPVA